jgi:tol-pal system protein YbgF
MTRWAMVWFLAAMFLALSPVDGRAQNRERQQIMAEVRMLHEQAMQLQLLITELKVFVTELSEQVDVQSSATARGFADQRLLIDDVSGDVRILREKIDDTNVRISSMSQEVEALRLAAPTMPSFGVLTDPETGLPVDPFGRAFPPGTGASRAPVIAPGVSPQRMYDTAWADYTNGQWQLAIEGFEAYLATFPGSELADDSQFYIGQTHYADGQFEQAVAAFDLVFQHHANGDVVPEAAYKRGLALDRLGETDKALESFELVVDSYPDSAMATLARQALDRLSQR